MAYGAIVQGGVVTWAGEAASDYDPNYGGAGVAFVPDPTGFVQPGDLWDGSKFTFHAVPAEITALQARRALNAAGLRATVDAAVAASSQDVKDAWEYATIVKRDNAIIASMANALHLTSEQVDDLFRAGAKFDQ